MDLISGTDRDYTIQVKTKEGISEFFKKPLNILYVILVVFALFIIRNYIVLFKRRRNLKNKRPKFNR